MRYFILTSFLILIFLVACKQPESEPQTNPSEKIYKIAYNVLVDEENENFEIFSMDLDGSNKQNITNLSGVEWTYHAWGNKILYVSDTDTLKRNYQLFTMNADGSLKEKLSDMRLADSWHGTRKNGQEIVVKPYNEVESTFYILSNGGEILRRLQPNLKYFSDPSFSPDGEKVVFRGAHFASKKEEGFVDEIYIMDADGSNLQQLTHYPKSDTTAAWYAYKAGPPKWHPTENFISYASFQNGKYSLFGVTPNGQKQWKLTTTTQNEVFHDWSSDGKWLVTDLAKTEQSSYHIGLINWETKALTILTDSTYQYHQSPVFVEVLQ